MSFFDDVKQKAAGMLGAKGEHAGVIETIMGMVTNRESGGLSALVESFREKGMGGIVSSWISTGRNEPVSPDQVEEGLGQDRIQQFASKAGISADEAKAKLAALLPEVVDKLTPEGKIPKEAAETK